MMKSQRLTYAFLDETPMGCLKEGMTLVEAADKD
jgi:hypothetical protein